DVVEAVELVDEAAVAARADAPAPVLVLVQETHPETEVLLPLDLVLRRPVEPVGAVRLAARLVELPERRNGVALMPVGVAGAHDVAVGLVDRERRIEHEAELEQLLHHRVPTVAAGLCGLLPQASRAREAMVLGVVVVIGGIVLDRAIIEARLRQTVPVREAAARERSVQSTPLPLPGSRIVVTPCASHSLYTYSAGVPCCAPPVWPCRSTKPGSAYMPWASISRVAPCGRRSSRMGSPGAPTPRISVIRFRSMTMSAGPQGGAPVPSMTVTPRTIRRSCGPSPSVRAGASGTVRWAAAGRASVAKDSAMAATRVRSMA